MSILLDTKRNGWIWQITLLSIVLGMLLAASLKTQQRIKSAEGIPTTRFSGLAQKFLDEKEKNKLLRNEITDLRTKVDRYEEAQGEGTAAARLLSDELRKAKLLAGLSAVKGQGVEVTLQDSPKRAPEDLPPELKDEYIIHDADLRNFVNELLANGAEAIAISDSESSQRIIANSSIRCVGAAIRVNGVTMTSPFVISAVGPPGVLESALKMPDGIIDQFRLISGLSSGMVQVKKRKEIVIPAYSESTKFIYASPADSERNSS